MEVNLIAAPAVSGPGRVPSTDRKAASKNAITVPCWMVEVAPVGTGTFPTIRWTSVFTQTVPFGISPDRSDRSRRVSGIAICGGCSPRAVEPHPRLRTKGGRRIAPPLSNGVVDMSGPPVKD
jgi:hypothetical protein